jgi:preprotein translocase subunit SecE
MARTENNGKGAKSAGSTDRDKASGADKKAPARKPAAKPAEKGPSRFERSKQFFREVRIELKKVTWPTRKETIASTSVILLLVVFVAAYLGLLDIGLSRVLKLLFH